MDKPWLSILGIGENGIAGLCDAARDSLQRASVIFGSPRHLQLADAKTRGCPWPIPFCIQSVLEHRGKSVVVLASGDPFWNGAGTLLAKQLPREEWQSFATPSSYALAAATQGWALEDTVCMGLHAAPFERLLPVLTRGMLVICLVRDEAAPALLSQWLTEHGFGESKLTVMECLGGPRERVRHCSAKDYGLVQMQAPVLVAFEVGGGQGLQRSAGLPDDVFTHDGQITRSAVRALTVSALAPRDGERLWDIGAGSGSVSVEWCLAARAATSIAMDNRPDRLLNVQRNACDFGLQHRIKALQTAAPDLLNEQPLPDAVFIGGGANQSMLEVLWSIVPEGTRVVANAVTLETETLISQWHAKVGGSLMRMEFAEATALGRGRGWQYARPVVQWSVLR